MANGVPALHPAKPAVAIIGGGWAGLPCALRLAQAVYAPIVYESAPEAGGRARRARLDGHHRDNGQHLMLAGCRSLTALLAEIGCPLPSAPFAYRNSEGHFSLSGWHRRSGLLFGLRSAACFSLVERLLLLKALLTLQWRNWRVPAAQTVQAWLAAQRQTPALIKRFWAPLVLAVLNTPLSQAAMTRLAPVLRDTLGASVDALQILQPAADLSASIVEPLVDVIKARGGQVHCGQRVTAVTNANGRYCIHFADCADMAAPHAFERIVLALPPWALIRLDLPWATTDLCRRFGAQPIATVYLRFDSRVCLPTPLLQIDGPLPGDARVWVMYRGHFGEPGV